MLLKEPLVHFLAAGLALFVLFGIVNRNGPEDDPTVVVVDQDALLTFVQYRLKAFDPELAERKLDGLSDEELRRLIEDYVREEVLHREAIALGLDRDDYVIRRRLVQKLEFITEGFVETSISEDPDAIGRYFDAHRDDYFVEPYVTFTHVFVDGEDRPPNETLSRARRKLEELNRNGTSFADAPKHGDRFLYHVNYVERTPEYVASHFGPAMAKAVFALEPNEFVWRGPFQSPYGAHLVLLVTSEPGRTPTLSEIEGRVIEDWRQSVIRERTEEAIDEIVSQYDVRVDYSRVTPRDASVDGTMAP